MVPPKSCMPCRHSLCCAPCLGAFVLALQQLILACWPESDRASHSGACCMQTGTRAAPLHAAAQKGYPELVALLLGTTGCKVDPRTTVGRLLGMWSHSCSCTALSCITADAEQSLWRPQAAATETQHRQCVVMFARHHDHFDTAYPPETCAHMVQPMPMHARAHHVAVV